MLGFEDVVRMSKTWPSRESRKWKSTDSDENRVAINSGPKNPKDLLKKRRVRRHTLLCFDMQASPTVLGLVKQYHRWMSTNSPSISDVKDAPRKGRPVVENVDKITEIIKVDGYVSSRSIFHKQKIDHKTDLSHLRKVGSKKKLHVLVPHEITPKKHDGSNFHLRSLGQTE
ncbi:histone-lysine N-methyltransferase SETMAR [Trichonephila clavipes]|nr:histone-lysine N-methyltransferase SETMAR [Trichonephila clavipes]